MNHFEKLFKSNIKICSQINSIWRILAYVGVYWHSVGSEYLNGL